MTKNCRTTVKEKPSYSSQLIVFIMEVLGLKVLMYFRTAISFGMGRIYLWLLDLAEVLSFIDYKESFIRFKYALQHSL